MVTVVYRMKVKQGCEGEFEDLVGQFRKSALETDGCITYTFYKSLADPAEFIVYYRFESRGSQDKHIKNLIKKFGPALRGRDLPGAFLDLIAEDELIMSADT